MPRRLLGLVAFGALASAAHADGTVRLSVDRSRHDANGQSGSPAMTPDARFVAFESDASDLVNDDGNGATDVFVRDRLRGSTERVSVDSSEREAHGASFDPAISADGRFVAFTSLAEDLVPDDDNHWSDVFVRDRLRKVTFRVSIGSRGGQGSEGSFAPAISADGRFAAFVSQAPDLVPDDFNFSWDVFVHGIESGVTERVSVDSAGVEADSGSLDPAISADGRFVAFASLASNLAPDDQNALLDVYLRDRALGVTERISRGPRGVEPDDHSFHPSLSGDADFVAFESRASNLVAGDGNGRSDVFVLDRAAGTLARASVDSFAAEADGHSFAPALSLSGRWVVFTSAASNLVADDENGVDDVFVHDRHTGVTARASLAVAGGEADGGSGDPCVSDDGDNVAFASLAQDLVPSDRNGARDVFARERCSAEARTAHYGAGWPGTLGEPQLLPESEPELNRTFRFAVTNSLGAPTVGLLLFGAHKAFVPTNRDGVLLVEPLAGDLLSLPADGLTVECPVPPDPSLCALEFDFQVVECDPGATKGASFSKGLEVRPGY
jgi:Tol biopolymer transport system component